MPVTWNPSDKGPNLTLSGGDLTVTCAATYYDQFVRATESKASGKWVFAGVMNTADYTEGIGVCNSTQDLTDDFLPLANATVALRDNNTWKYNGTSPGTTTQYWASATEVMIAVDATARTVWMSTDGGTTWYGSASGDPAAGTNGQAVGFTGDIFPCLTTADGRSWVGRFTDADIVGTIPSGFSAWDSPAAATVWAQPNAFQMWPQGSGPASFTLTAEAGSFAMTGVAANLLYGRLLTAAAGSFTMTGIAASLERSYTLVAAAGSFGVTGNDAALLYGRSLAAGAGAFTLTGVAAGLLASRVLTASAGAFALSGQDAGMLAGRVVTAEAGSFALTGNDATLVYNPVGSYTLVAEAGSFALTGNDAALTTARLLTAEAGSFDLTGIAADLIYDGTPIVEPPAGGLSYGGGAAAPSRKRLQQILDEFRAEKRAERERQRALTIAKRPRVIGKPPQAVVGPEHTSDDDDEEALAWILESTL